MNMTSDENRKKGTIQAGIPLFHSQRPIALAPPTKSQNAAR